MGSRGEHLLDRHGVRHDLGVDPRLAHPAGDELGVLGAEVDDEDQVVFGGQAGPFEAMSSSASGSSLSAENGPKFLGPSRNPAGKASLEARRPGAFSLPGRVFAVQAAAWTVRARPSSLPGRALDDFSRALRDRAGIRRLRQTLDDRQPQRRRGVASGTAGSFGATGSIALVRPTRAPGAGRARPCWARTTSPAPPGR